MDFEILAADSLGVRALAVLVRDAPGGPVLIDPGAALGPRRFGLPPHAEERAALAAAVGRLAAGADLARRIVVTHYHHDHFAPFQERDGIAGGLQLARSLYAGKTVHLRDPAGPVNPRQAGRARRLAADLARLDVRILATDGRARGDLVFSPPVRHGDADSPGGWLVMVAVKTPGGTLAHLSDTQLLCDEAVDWALARTPAVAVTAGPPLYLPGLGGERIARARRNLTRLVERVPLVVADHHLRRGGDVEAFLSEPAERAVARGHRLASAAEAMGRPARCLESQRRELHARG